MAQPRVPGGRLLGTHILHPPVAAGAQQGVETITAEVQGSGLRALGRMNQGRIRKVLLWPWAEVAGGTTAPSPGAQGVLSPAPTPLPEPLSVSLIPAPTWCPWAPPPRTTLEAGSVPCPNTQLSPAVNKWQMPTKLKPCWVLSLLCRAEQAPQIGVPKWARGAGYETCRQHVVVSLLCHECQKERGSPYNSGVIS